VKRLHLADRQVGGDVACLRVGVAGRRHHGGAGEAGGITLNRRAEAGGRPRVIVGLGLRRRAGRQGRFPGDGWVAIERTWLMLVLTMFGRL
jgi:hypothetical protein